jgi:hypothetical protein
MNLTRLGELLDLADNAALTASQARELGDAQAQLREATAWTAEAPRRPGLYAWRTGADTAAVVVRVVDHPTGILTAWETASEGWRDVTELGGTWSGPMVPAREETP